MIDFSLGATSEQLRSDTASFLDEILTPDVLDECRRTGTNHSTTFARALAEKGWQAMGWPIEDGGGGRDPIEMLACNEELARRGAPTYGITTTMIVAQTLREFGTPTQRHQIISRALAGEIVIALGFTEPENGSDAAAASTRAVRDDNGDWLITGTKMFTTNAHVADYVFILARTNPEAPKHHGLTTFLLPLHQQDVDVRGIDTLSGERTNVTYYEQARVSDEFRIGEVDQGWQVMTTALSREHASGFAGAQYQLVNALMDWATTPAAQIRADDRVQTRIGKSLAEFEVSTLLQRRAAWLISEDLPVQGRGSMSKLFSSDRLEQQAADILELVGPDALRGHDDQAAVQSGFFEHAVRHAKGTTIYGGTSEIHRNMIARHVLGLPRQA